MSPSGFYDRDRRRLAPGFRAREDQALAGQITAIHAESRRTYGSPTNSVPVEADMDATALPVS